MGVDFRVLYFGMDLYLYRWPSDSDGVIQMISTTYLNWAKDNNADVRVKLKNNEVLQGKIKRVWWDDFEDRIEFVGEGGMRKQIGAKDIEIISFL